MKKELEVRQEIKLDASSGEVWRVLTDPQDIKKYFFGTNVSSEWKEGSAIEFRGEWEGSEYIDKGTILELIPERKLVYNYWSSMSGTPDIPENYGLITYRLTPEGNSTILEITQQGFDDEEKRDHSSGSWKSVLESMKEVLYSRTMA
jgi:uncharacterized protein YndB with AHSA1/START domain